MMVPRTRQAAALLGAASLLIGAGTAAEPARLSGAFGQYLVGHYAAQSHDVALAADALGHVIRDDPGIPELNNQAFLAALLAGQPQALQLAAQLPTNPLAQLVLADRDAKDGRWADAERVYAALPREDALTQILRPLLVAWSQFGDGRPGDALQSLLPLAEGPRAGGIFTLHAAMIADLAGRTDDATRLYAKAAVDYGPANLRLAMIVANWQARQSHPDAAQRTINELSNAESDLAMVRQGLVSDMTTRPVAGPTDGIAEAYLVLAATLRQQNNEVAQVIVRLALDMRPDFTAARLLLTDIEASAGRPQDALETLRTISADDKLAPLVALRRASLLAQTGQSEAADAILSELARAYPDRPEPLIQRGDDLRRERRFADAATAYARAVDRLGTPHRSDWPLFYARGIALERSGRWPEAEQDLQYALKLAPEQPSVLNYLAYSWTERGVRLAEARQMLERAVSARPREGGIIDSLGWVMLRQGENEGALQQLQHAAELEPEDPVINLHLGDALAAVGRMREAEFQWRRALILKPDEEDAKKLNEKLAALPDPNPAPIPPTEMPPAPR